MAQIKWSKQALNDIDQICEFISQDSLYYSEFFAQKTILNIERLKDFPSSGRIVPEISSENIREIIQGNYRIIYSYKDSIITLLTIYHCARIIDSDNLI